MFEERLTVARQRMRDAEAAAAAAAAAQQEAELQRRRLAEDLDACARKLEDCNTESDAMLAALVLLADGAGRRLTAASKHKWFVKGGVTLIVRNNSHR